MKKLSKSAEALLKNRYLLRDKEGKVCETPLQLFLRTAKAAAGAEALDSRASQQKQLEHRFAKLMCDGLFLPNSPALMNAGTEIGQLMACFVLPIEDSLASIFDCLRSAALIHQSGGGTGFNFGSLRKKGDIVNRTHGVSSGPVSFMRLFDAAADTVRQGGRRRGANMGILPFDHPDIIEFIEAKKGRASLTNFNLSVLLSDKFMASLKKGGSYPVIDPRTKKPCARKDAHELFLKLVENSWESGDPGVLFSDRINRDNPLPKMGRIEATNPCGEQPLLPYEACVLGSIAICEFAKGDGVDFKKLRGSVHLAVRFLDDLIDASKYPLPRIEEATKASRKIGLGIMGFADLLIKLGLPYSSQKAVALAEEIMKFIQEEGRAASEELGKIKGSFPAFKESIYRNKFKALRNASVTTVAPTGALSIIAGCSSGIEPIFAVAWARQLGGKEEVTEHNSMFEQAAKKGRFWSNDTIKSILLNEGSVSCLEGVPDNIKVLFARGLDIPAHWHVSMAAAFQKYTDGGVSKTVNLLPGATKEDVRDIFLLSHKLKCKGITVFRSGCKKERELCIKPEDTGRIVVESDFSGGSAAGYCCA